VIETKFQWEYKTGTQTRTTSQLHINYNNLALTAKNKEQTHSLQRLKSKTKGCKRL